MMHLYVLRWDINPKAGDRYVAWAQKAITKSLEVPGVKEVRAYRPLAGESQVVVTFEFKDFDSWSTWFNDDPIQKLFTELYGMGLNVETELWEPSPIAPVPLRGEDSQAEE
ncbi:MAG: antibiotic biosynthesis monooxygenase [Candidatus Promineifilaceae bacterium]|jgi:antibiotic biosynthesis monooxygenase (ABM) superfamily enzyme